MSDNTADRMRIIELLAEQDTAWRRGDADGFAAKVGLEIVFTNIVGMFSVGRAPFVAQHARIFATIYRGSTLRQEVEHITFVRPDVAVVDTVAAVTGFSTLPPGAEAVDGVLRTRIEQVMVRDGGVWSVAAFHNVPINPAAIAAGPP